MKVYTKTGDKGETSLFSRERVPKDHVRIQVYGTLDEASAALGMAKALAKQQWVCEKIEQVQQDLILLCGDLATPELKKDRQYLITEGHIASLEQQIDELEEKRIPQKYFITPGASAVSAAIDLARSIVRRAERAVVTAKRTETIPQTVFLYMNRLSDFLFVLARCAEQEEIIAAATRGVLGALQEAVADGARKGEGSMLAKAKQVVAAAEQKAVEMGIPMVIAVVDQGGNLVLQERMDNSVLAGIALAVDKAFTAVSLKMPTSEVAKAVQPGQPLFGLASNGQGRYVVFGGGFPLEAGGQVVGAIGVSGGTVEEDMAVAKAGLAVW